VCSLQFLWMVSATIKGHARLHAWRGYCTSHCMWVWRGDHGGKPVQWGAHVANILRHCGADEADSYIFWSDGNGGSRHGAWMLLVATVGRWSCGGEWIDEAEEENLKEADGKEKRLLLQSVVVNRRLKSSIQWVMWWWMEVSQSIKTTNGTVKASRDVVLVFG
jgi:hypothetical protein